MQSGKSPIVWELGNDRERFGKGKKCLVKLWRDQTNSSVLHVFCMTAYIEITKELFVLPGISLQLLDCPRLIETIVREFLPTQWDPKVAEPGFLLTSLHGVACASAMKFIRVLASGGRNATARLVSGSWKNFSDCKGLCSLCLPS